MFGDEAGKLPQFAIDSSTTEVERFLTTPDGIAWLAAPHPRADRQAYHWLLDTVQGHTWSGESQGQQWAAESGEATWYRTVIENYAAAAAVAVTRPSHAPPITSGGDASIVGADVDMHPAPPNGITAGTGTADTSS